MKKIVSIFLALVMILATLAFVGCTGETNDGENNENNNDATLKFGLGLYTNVSKATDATEDTEGQGKVAITAAVITVDADGKIVACDLDTADITVKYTFEGKAVANDSFLTKYEQGDAYSMKAYGGAAKEWYEQADAFETVVIGKTVDEVKALVAAEDKGTEEVINAGCTIMVNEFVRAIEKAFANLADANVTAANSVKLGANTEQSVKDANEDAEGSNQIETTFFAAALDADGKIVAASSDCVQVKFTFDAAGASTYDLTKAASSKKELGDNYGMKAYGGAAKEWYEQAAAFDAACIGKTAGDVNALLGADNRGNEDLQSAGCTILVNGLVKAAAKVG